MKSRYRSLYEKSLQAALSAIELYNKPNFLYREESFSILMTNAWELLLKAKVVKENNGRLNCLYIPKATKGKSGKTLKRPRYKTNRAGNFQTVGLNDLIDKHISSPNLKIQIETLIEIRDNSIHFMNSTKLFEKNLLEVATASLKSYKILSEEWFGDSLDNQNLFLIPIAFNIPETFNVDNLKNETKTHKNLLEYIRRQKALQGEKDDHDISLNVDLKISRKGDGFSVSFDKQGIPIVIDTEESFKNKYPLDYKALTEKLKERYTNFLANRYYHKLRKEICEKNPGLTGERYLDYARQSGTKKMY